MDWHQYFLHKLGQQPAPFEQLLAFRVLDYRADSAVAVLEFAGSAQFASAMGSVHGGACAAMLDQAMGVAALFASDFDSWFPTLELKTSFLRPAAAARPFKARANAVRMGRGVAFLEGRLSDSEGTLVATASATARRLSKPKPAH